MPIKRVILWRLTLAAAIVLAIISFTPIVIPTREIEPTLVGMPVTLWTGIIVAFLFVVLTYIAGRIHPQNWNTDDRKNNGQHT